MEISTVLHDSTCIFLLGYILLDNFEIVWKVIRVGIVYETLTKCYSKVTSEICFFVILDQRIPLPIRLCLGRIDRRRRRR